ncbi:MAG: carboxypeptidase regulatory-like domain-containing protein [Cyanobacteria bacterium]|nr:carboxypeptidase regulatory-like domain-containing protein [Cyanobacteriota bacterium]
MRAISAESLLTMVRCGRRSIFSPFLATALFVVGCVNPGSAQPSDRGTVSGKVTDSRSGGVVADALVVLSSPLRTVSAASGSDGTFSIPDVPHDAYHMAVLAQSYVPFTTEIALQAGSMHVDIRLPPQAPGTDVLRKGLQVGADGEPHLHVGANFDLLGAYRSFGPVSEQRQIFLREAEVALEAEVTPWLTAFLFLTRPDQDRVNIEEAFGTFRLPGNLLLRAGNYRVDFGSLNAIHEPERPQVTLPLPVVEFFGEEQLREGAVSLGRLVPFGAGHRLGISGGIWNGDNEIAFGARASRTKPVAGRIEYGFESKRFATQVSVSGVTGANSAAPDNRTTALAFGFNAFISPRYNVGYDYSSRFAFFSELLRNRRSLEATASLRPEANDALGGWFVADYQPVKSHHIGIGGEYTQGVLDDSIIRRAIAAHYSWYYSPHSRLQFEVRRVRGLPSDRGVEALLQFNIVLGPHSERAFLPVLPFQTETVVH